MDEEETQIMTSKKRSLIVVAVFVLCLLVVLGILLLTQVDVSISTDDTTEDTTTYVYSGSRDDIATMVISNEYGEYTVTQDDDGTFTIDELEGLNQNSTTLAAAGNCISSITAQSLVEENAEDLAKYGLSEDDPTAKVVVTLNDGTEYTVYYGIDSADSTSSTVYVRMGDSNDVYTVLSNSSRYFYYAKEDFISLIILSELTSTSTSPTIDYMIVTRKDLDYDITFEDDTKNYATDEVSMASSQVMTSPVYAYLDITNSNDVIYGLWGLTASDAVCPFPTEEDWDYYGLSDPFCTVYIEAELQTYSLIIGNVASYATDDSGNDTSEPAYYYGYYEGIDCVYTFAVDDLPWTTFMPVDIMSSLMTSNYIYRVDYINIEFYEDGETTDYYFDVTADEDEDYLVATYNNEFVDIDTFKVLYQFILKCPIDDLCLEDPDEDSELICKMEIITETGGDVLEFYDDGNNRVTIKMNGTTSFSQPISYIQTLQTNLETFINGGTSDDILMAW